MTHTPWVRASRDVLSVPRFTAALWLLGLLTLGGCSSHGSSSSLSSLSSPSSPGLTSIQITPTNSSVAAGTSVQLAATAIYSDNSHADVTAQVSWAASNTALATVGASTGKALGVAVGSVTINASLQGQTASTTLTVTPAKLVSIAVTPPIPSIAAGATEQFTATGTFSDNTTQNLTADLAWASSDTAVATVSAGALASAVGPGSTTISAACKVASICASLSASATLTVTPATLVSIAVTPSAPSIAPGSSKTFTATGTYSDHSTHNLSSQVTWSSATPAVATISNASGSAGVATAAAPGTTQVTAVLGGVTSPAITLTVTSATLVSIAITPSAPSIALGTGETFTATGTYSDHSTQNLSSQVTWIAATPAVATISNASGSAGVATAAAPGTTQVTAALGSVTSPAITLTVTSATLVSIAITPSAPSIPLAGSKAFIATGTYSDNSTQILTTTVTWASSDTSVAAINNAAGSQGLVTGLAVGTTSISAALGSVTSPTVTLTVTAQSVLYSFAGGSDGADPQAGLIQGADGNFYGTTYNGGANGLGAVFQITPAGVETVLYSFARGGDGEYPSASLIQGADGNFYGTTVDGGANGAGTVFRITPAGIETVLWSFGSVSDGGYPLAGLIQGADGNFYGTTTGGGANYNNNGTIFKITPAGVETMLYSFASAAGDGADPQASLIQGADGNFYGTTYQGGTNNFGTVFQITPAGVETVLWSFGSGSDGLLPYAGLIQGADGNFYGTTVAGGANNFGTVFQITPAGVETVLYSFGSAGDGEYLYAGLIQAADGNFYGTTYLGGTSGAGTIFQITPAGVETVLYSFGSAGEGSNPQAGLIQGTDGNFYGTTPGGGANIFGTVFKF